MPDWRNPDDYRFPTDFPGFRWAWEFLRRNPKYRSDWRAAVLRYVNGTGEFRTRGRLVERNADGRPIGLCFSAWTPGLDPTDPDFHLPARERKKWFLSYMFNPDSDFPRDLNFLVGYGHVALFREGQENLVSPAGLQYPWAMFDLTLPLKPQVEKVLITLQDLQKEQGFRPRRIKHHRQLWPMYLRLLDADLDKRTPRQMADSLEAEEDGLDERKLWDRLQSARRMTTPEDGYLTIFLSKP